MGFLVIAITALLGVAGVVLLASARKRIMFVYFALASCIPLIAGFMATSKAYSRIEAAAEARPGIVSREMRDIELAHARLPFLAGAGGFGALLIVTLAGLLICRDLCKEHRGDKDDSGPAQSK